MASLRDIIKLIPGNNLLYLIYEKVLQDQEDDTQGMWETHGCGRQRYRHHAQL